jgi:hypothetical protein
MIDRRDKRHVHCLVAYVDRPAADANAGQAVVIDEMTFHLAGNEADAAREISVVHRNDAEYLKSGSERADGLGQ